MSRNEIFEGLKEVLSVIKPKTDLSQVTESTQLVSELGIDSLSMLLLSLASEQKFQIKFETEAPFETVGAVIDYIEKALA